MSYSGPGSVVSLVDEFISHWAGVDGAMAPGTMLVVPEGAAVTKSRADLTILRGMYFAALASHSPKNTWEPALLRARLSQ